MSTLGLPTVLWLILWTLGTALLITWIFLPWAVFGTKPLLKELLAESKRTNALLEQLLARSK